MMLRQPDTKLLIQRRFRFIALITLAWVLLLVFVGAIAQVTNSGVACPAWFLCSNQTTPPLQTTIWLNFIHHLSGSIAALLTIGVVIFARYAYGQYPLMIRLTSVALGFAFFQILLIAGTIGLNYHLLARVFYLLAILVYLGLMATLTMIAYLPETKYLANPGVVHKLHQNYARLLLFTGGMLLALLFSGIVVTGTGAVTACPDWPLCRGELLPFSGNPAVFINLFHRFSVVLVSILMATIILQSCRHFAQQRLITKWAAIVGLLYLAQIAVGGWSVLMPLPRVITIAIHLTLTAVIWSSLVVLTTLFYLIAPTLPEQPLETVRTSLSFRQKAGVYFKLTKPWIMILLLITTVTAMFIAAKGMPPLSLILLTTMGGALASGGASVLNSYVDSDIDQLMSRTSRRATVTGLVTPRETLLFGLILSVLSFFVYALFINTLSAALSTLGILYYVFFYTLYLKRTTIHNIIIGGAAGAIPPLVGWTAVTGQLDLGAFYLFAIIFFWTPPHTWALALLVKKDYAQARVPMLPVVVGEQQTTYQIFLYTILLITLTLLPVTFNMLSLVYLVAAIALGLPFLYLAWKLWRAFDKASSKKLYKFSQLYLALLFLIMAIDRSFFV